MKDLQIDDYNPWGKPGHGAPNEDTLRKRKIFMDVLPPVVLKVQERYTHLSHKFCIFIYFLKL